MPVEDIANLSISDAAAAGLVLELNSAAWGSIAIWPTNVVHAQQAPEGTLTLSHDEVAALLCAGGGVDWARELVRAVISTKSVFAGAVVEDGQRLCGGAYTAHALRRSP